MHKKQVLRAATVVEPLVYTRDQALYKLSETRFNVVPAGRRSGKTAIAKRRLRKKAMRWQGAFGTRFIAAAPTHGQAKRIYWSDIKLMFPRTWRLATSESELSITLVNGAIVQVMGLDEPARAEGPPVAHLLLDEYGNMKPSVWEDHLRPTLTDTQGTADIIGAPEGRNHYYEMWLAAQADETGEWAAHTWWTEHVLPNYLGEAAAKREIESAQRSMDYMTFCQEYRAEFVSFEGLAYYCWDRSLHASETLRYNPNYPLIFCFDFNRKPGVAVVCQYMPYRGRNSRVAAKAVHVIGEVYIPRNSSTPAVCRKLAKDWGGHKGDVYLYGDSTGGAKTTQSVAGSDWDLVSQYLRPVFGDRLIDKVETNPRERVRVNAVNSRLMSADGVVHLLVCPKNAPHLIRDFEATIVKEGGSGEIDKDHDGKKWSHMTDGLGYYIHGEFPVYTDEENLVVQTIG